MPAGNPQAYMRQGMPKRQAFALALQKMKQNPGRRIGRNPTPGVPRRVGPPTNLKGGPFNHGRQSYQSYQQHGMIDDTPGANPPDRTLGQRRLGRLSDNNRRNDKVGLGVAMRLFGRAQQGKGFGYKAFGERVGGGKQSQDSMADFFRVMAPYLQGTGYNRMFRQAAGMPTRPRRPKPRPMPLPTPEPTE